MKSSLYPMSVLMFVWLAVSTGFADGMSFSQAQVLGVHLGTTDVLCACDPVGGQVGGSFGEANYDQEPVVTHFFDPIAGGIFSQQVTLPQTLVACDGATASYELDASVTLEVGPDFIEFSRSVSASAGGGASPGVVDDCNRGGGTVQTGEFLHDHPVLAVTPGTNELRLFFTVDEEVELTLESESGSLCVDCNPDPNKCVSSSSGGFGFTFAGGGGGVTVNGEGQTSSCNLGYGEPNTPACLRWVLTPGNDYQIIFSHNIDIGVFAAPGSDFAAGVSLTGNYNVRFVAAVQSFDVDIDSDNDSILDHFAPDRTQEEDDLEDDSAEQGRLVALNTDDDDGDGIPDWADGYNFDGVANTADDVNSKENDFVQIVIELPERADDEYKLVYRFEEDLVCEDQPQTIGIWTKPGTAPRESSQHTGGDPEADDFFALGEELVIDPANMPHYNPSTRELSLWLEGIAPGARSKLTFDLIGPCTVDSDVIQLRVEEEYQLETPYTGTINSLRRATSAMPHGEVLNGTFPRFDTAFSGTVKIWHEPVGTQNWDTSVLKFYTEFDGSGQSIDLTSRTERANAYETSSLSHPLRYSLRTVATKTLGPVQFRIHMASGDCYYGSQLITVVPMSAQHLGIGGESQLFLSGVPMLDIQMGGASLAITSGMRIHDVGRGTVLQTDVGDSVRHAVTMAGGIEQCFIPDDEQFAQGAFGKTSYGTPWSAHMRGYHVNADGEPLGPDGTLYEVSAFKPRVDGYPMPLGPEVDLDRGAVLTGVYPHGSTTTSVQTSYSSHGGSLRYFSRATAITDTLGNTLALNPSGTILIITTSDGRKWTVRGDAWGRITEISPGDGFGARFYEYGPFDNELLRDRITKVSLSGSLTMYEFEYDPSTGDLLKEKHWVGDPGLLATVVEHLGGTRRDYVSPGLYQKTVLQYAAGSQLLSETTYEDLNGAGAASTTTLSYVSGSELNLIDVARLADGTSRKYEYDASPSSVELGLVSKITHQGNTNLILVDRTYQLLNGTKLYYSPRVKTERDGRGASTEVVNEYGDENLNTLTSITGPTVVADMSMRKPKTELMYLPGTSVLSMRKVRYAAGVTRDTQLGYDPHLRPTSTSRDPGGLDLTNSVNHFDDLAQRTQATDEDGYVVERQHDYSGRPRFVRQYFGVTTGEYYETQHVYDTYGRLASSLRENTDQDGDAIDGEPAWISVVYDRDRLGRVLRRTVDPGGIGQTTEYEYDWLGQVVRTFDSSGRGTKTTYNGYGLPALVTPLALGGAETPALATATDYDDMKRATFTTLPTGARVENLYDDFGRVEKVIRHPGPDGGMFIITKTEFDAASNATAVIVYEATTAAADPNAGTVLSDTRHLYDEVGLRYETRRRLTFGADSDADPRTRWEFDWAGNVIKETSSGDTVDDQVFDYVLDKANRVRSISDSAGGLVTLELDGRGNLIAQTVQLDSGAVATSIFEYDALGRRIGYVDPELHAHASFYDSRGNLRRRNTRGYSSEPADPADPPVLAQVYEYDAAGRRTSTAVMSNPDSTAAPDPSIDRVIHMQYDPDGRLTHRMTYNGGSATPLTTQYDYDTLGRLEFVTGPNGAVQQTEFALNGRVLRSTSNEMPGTFTASARVIEPEYDGHDRVTGTTAVAQDAADPDLVTVRSLDGLGRVVLQVSPLGIMTETKYDLAGRMTRVTEDFGGALERETEYSFDPLGRMQRREAKNRSLSGGTLATQITRYRYDSLGRLLRTYYPDTTDTNFEQASCSDCVRMTYDDAGRMTTRQDQRGLLTEYTYDRRGLLLFRTTGDDQDQYLYDALGRMTSAVRGTLTGGVFTADATSTREYTTLGDLDFEDQTIFGNATLRVDFGHDQAGIRDQLIYPGGTTIDYQPNAMHQIESMAFGSQQTVSYNYHFADGGPLVNRRATNTGAGTTYRLNWDYDSHRRVNRVKNTYAQGGSSTIAEYTLEHDLHANPIKQTVTGFGEYRRDDRDYEVDRLDRLVETEYGEFQTTEVNDLDLLGNRENQTDRDGFSRVYGAVNSANEYVALGYDEAGNLTTDEDGRTYLYDDKSQLREVRDAGGVLLASYVYDALGRRVSATIGLETTQTYFDGVREIETRNAAGARTGYTINGTQYVDERIARWDDSAGAYEYFVLGDQFSVVGAGDATASGWTRYPYDAHGSPSVPDHSAGADLGCPACTSNPQCSGDVDGDGMVGLSDLGAVLSAVNTSTGQPGYDPCADFDCSGTVDSVSDLAVVLADFGTSCPEFEAPPSGTYGLHGRPIDVLPDGKALIWTRARVYDPEHGRWLQRDPSGYVDGSNLYESFRGNPARSVDPWGLFSDPYTIGRYSAGDHRISVTLPRTAENQRQGPPPTPLPLDHPRVGAVFGAAGSVAGMAAVAAGTVQSGGTLSPVTYPLAVVLTDNLQASLRTLWSGEHVKPEVVMLAGDVGTALHSDPDMGRFQGELVAGFLEALLPSTALGRVPGLARIPSVDPGELRPITLADAPQSSEARAVAAIVEQKSRRVSLGKTRGLPAFSERVNASDYKNWGGDVEHWQARFLELMADPRIDVHVNLDSDGGAVNAWESVTRAASRRGAPFDWELMLIYENSDWWPRITWYKNGEVVPNPFE